MSKEKSEKQTLSDSLLTVEELCSLYGNVNGEYPAYPKDEWKECVEREETTTGYWEWVHHMLLEEIEVDEEQSPSVPDEERSPKATIVTIMEEQSKLVRSQLSPGEIFIYTAPQAARVLKMVPGLDFWQRSDMSSMDILLSGDHAGTLDENRPRAGVQRMNVTAKAI